MPIQVVKTTVANDFVTCGNNSVSSLSPASSAVKIHCLSSLICDTCLGEAETGPKVFLLQSTVSSYSELFGKQFLATCVLKGGNSLVYCFAVSLCGVILSSEVKQKLVFLVFLCWIIRSRRFFDGPWGRAPCASERLVICSRVYF